jgi:hypothetical protein
MLSVAALRVAEYLSQAPSSLPPPNDSCESWRIALAVSVMATNGAQLQLVTATTGVRQNVLQ